MKVRSLYVPVGPWVVEADLAMPAGAAGIVLFAHGSGSSRDSPRNRFVAQRLHEHGLATLLVDLLTEVEANRAGPDSSSGLDLDFLAERFGQVTDWVTQHSPAGGLNIGYFGGSSGAAVALKSAADRPHLIGAIVCRGGRTDLANEVLPYVRAPTLLVVGSADRRVLEMNRHALHQLPGPKSLIVVAAAGHLFEEPGALDQVANQATDWFLRHLAGRGGPDVE